MEFKRLSDVEVVAEPTESANVLIEENGVIKKAPKTAVGGNSDSSYYIFYENGNVTATDGIYDAIVENLFTNVTGITIRTFNINSYDGGQGVQEFTVYNFAYYPDAEEIQISCSDGMLFILHKNGDHSYYWD